MNCKQGIKVLSLFDGMSCTQIALNRLGLDVDAYYASEVDKYAIKVTQANWPDTVQLGDVRGVTRESVGTDVDLIVAGSPCQDLSFAGKGKGLIEGERSNLFFEFVRILDEFKPKYFFLENVRMKQEYQDIITDMLGVPPIAINSSLVSAQSRNRLYWTNIPQSGMPTDKGIVLKDILEDLPFEEIPNYLNNTWCGRKRGDLVKSVEDDKASCLTASMYKGQIPTFVKKPIHVGMMVETVKVRKHKVDVPNLQKLLREAKGRSGKTNRQIANDTDMPITKVEHWFRTDSSFAIPSDDVWYKLKDVLGINIDSFDKQIMEFEYRDGVYESTQRVYSEYGKSPTITASNMAQFIETTSDKPIQVGETTNIKGFDSIKRVYHPNGKSPTLTTMQGGHREPKVAITGGAIRGRYKVNGVRQDHKHSVAGMTTQQLELRLDEKTNCLTTVQKDNVAVDATHWLYRKLTPKECERLQTVPDDYTNHVSKTQRYKMLGNGMTVDVLCHLMKGV